MRWQGSFKFLLIILSFAFLVLGSTPPKALAITNPISYEITVSATVGEPKLTLFGYSSPHSLVELRGTRVTEQVIADEEGYFFFDRAFLPPPAPDYPEVCLTAIDTQSRISFPTCLPPLPVGPYEITVGPVLLPPTISLEKGNFLPGEQVAAQGATIPNTPVTIYLYSANWPSYKGVSFISPVLAYSLPKYQIQADKNGHFEFNLPANRPNRWRVFAASYFLESPTPKSNTLAFKILNWWEWLWQKIREILMLLLGLLRPHLWKIIILAEIGIILYLLWRRKKLSKVNFHSLR